MKLLNWIKTNYILVLFGILILIILFLWMKNKSLNKQIDIKNVELMAQTDTVKAYKTKAGDAYFVMKSVVIESNALKASLKADAIELNKLKAENINWRDIVSVQKLQLEAAGHIIANMHDSIIHDTIVGKPDINVKIFNWSNNYLLLTGIVNNNLFDAHYIYKINQQLITQKKGNSYIVTATIDDPNAKIITGSQIIVTPTKHWWQAPWIWGIAGMAAGIYITH
jgi:hypothetical protein